jgi:ATP-dependent Clp protease ATP-binding subunit ClpB
MVRIDMSEYMERHTVSRLLGAPPGYVGYEEGGSLTEAVRRRPYSVVLFDEIEKAHGDVFNTLLQLLDDGRLTDGHGRTVDFRNVVIIMTSNIGSERILALTGEDPARMESEVLELLRRQFKPEFLNRVDDIVVFHNLSREHLGSIVDIQLRGLEALLAERRISLEVTPEAREWLADQGYDPAYGARPLKRVISKRLKDALALRLLEAKSAGPLKVQVDAKDDGLSFDIEPA